MQATHDGAVDVALGTTDCASFGMSFGALLLLPGVVAREIDGHRWDLLGSIDEFTFYEQADRGVEPGRFERLQFFQRAIARRGAPEHAQQDRVRGLGELV